MVISVASSFSSSFSYTLNRTCGHRLWFFSRAFVRQSSPVCTHHQQKEYRLYFLKQEQTYFVNLQLASQQGFIARGSLSSMSTISFFNKDTPNLLGSVKVQGIAPPESNDFLFGEKTYDEQTAALQRQLRRLRLESSEDDGNDWEGEDERTVEDDVEEVNNEGDSDDGNNDGDFSGDTPMQKGHLIYFQTKVEEEELWCSVYRDALVSRGENVGSTGVEQDIESIPVSGRWCVLMISGGHFAGAIIDKGKFIRHKTFHRYVVRAKRGTVQSVRDAKSGTSQPKSAGSNLRRYNEQQLRDDVANLLNEWSDDLKQCEIILHRSSVHNRSFLFQSSKQLKKVGTRDESCLLIANDPRVRSVPFPTNRPTLDEIARVYAVLTSITILDGEPHYIMEHRMLQQKEDEKIRIERQKQADKDVVNTANEHEGKEAIVKTELYEACLKGDLSKVRRMLSDDNADFVSVVAEINVLCGKFKETALHAASKRGFPDIVTHLLDNGADPTLLNVKRKPPYAVSKTKDVRDEFRRFAYRAPGAFDLKLAQIPSALTPEQEQKRDDRKKEFQQKEKERKKELRKQQRQKKKVEEEEAQKAKEEEEKKRVPKVKMSDAGRARQLRVEAALSRLKDSQPTALPEDHCSYCLGDLSALKGDFFKRLDFKYCSMKCLKTHKQSLQSKS
eukprot:m.66990 g.66990  ORF g.66990 m.66990 type:complete len:672 (-) comp8201_c0_seq2:124-2139(-)